MPHVYSPVRQGFAQSAYPDQQATALAGDLAFAGDTNRVDAFAVGQVGPDGLEAGTAVISVPVPSASRPGLNDHAVTAPTSKTKAAQIVGVVVRGGQMATNASGRACHFSGDMCNIALTGRSGARIWVRLVAGAQPEPDSEAHVHIDAAHAGLFASAPGEGTVTPGTMRFKSTAADGIALVELR